MARMIALFLACIPIAGASAAAQSLDSPAAAADLVRLLDTRKLEAISALDPADPGRFVAALYIPGAQLLVVSGKHPDVNALKYRMLNGAHRDVYLDVQGTPTPKGKLFVQDASADGLRAAPADGAAADIVYTDGTTTLMIDGKAKQQGLSATDYQGKVKELDGRYVHALQLLTAALTTSS